MQQGEPSGVRVPLPYGGGGHATWIPGQHRRQEHPVPGEFIIWDYTFYRTLALHNEDLHNEYGVKKVVIQTGFLTF
jgi:hypothetical protein